MSIGEYANPFRPTRFEHHGRPLIWLSSKALQLEAQQSFYVSGTRGTGKTTLLRSLHWWERANNETLKAQVDARAVPFIGLYFRLPDYAANSLANIRWEGIFPEAPNIEDLEFWYFTIFIEVIALQLLCEAASEMRAAGVFTFTPEHERALLDELASDLPELREYVHDGSGTFTALEAALTSVYEEMHVAAVRGTVGALVKKLPAGADGDLLHRVGLKIIDFLSRWRSHESSESSERIHVKVCVDDCEMLVERQQKYLNTLVRKAKFPIFWVISYVGSNYQTTATMIPQQSLSDADRKMIDLESPSNENTREFVSLCERVSSLRMYYSDREASSRSFEFKKGRLFFDVKKILGPTDINVFLHNIRRKKLKSAWDVLASKAEEIEDVFRPVSPAEPLDEGEALGGAPLYYQAYLMQRLAGSSDVTQLRRESKKAFSAYLRRKQRAALLSLCSEFRVSNIPYAGWHVVLSMADGSIRDYLEIMANIYDSFEAKSKKIDAFRTTSLSLELQRKSIFRASQEKFDGIKESMESHTAEGSALVTFLGRLCARLQSDHRNIDCLRTPERGIFVFDLERVSGRTSQQQRELQHLVRQVLLKSELAGVLRAEGELDSLNGTHSGPLTLRYRLHRRFCAYFGYSYRGPYAEVSVPMEAIVSACVEPETADVSALVDLAVRSQKKNELLQPSFELYIGKNGAS